MRTVMSAVSLCLSKLTENVPHRSERIEVKTMAKVGLTPAKVYKFRGVGKNSDAQNT